MRPIARAQSARASSVNQARKGRAKSKTIRRRCGDVAYIVDLRVGRFSDSTFPSFPPAPPLSPLLAAIYLLLLFPLGCATPRRGVLISITFGSQTRIGFLSLSLSLSFSFHPDGTKSRGWQDRARGWKSRKGKRMEKGKHVSGGGRYMSDKGKGGKGGESSGGDRQSLIFRVLAPPFPREFSFHFARPPDPLFHFAALFAENS